MSGSLSQGILIMQKGLGYLAQLGCLSISSARNLHCIGAICCANPRTGHLGFAVLQCIVQK